MILSKFVIESSALAKKKDEPGVSKFDGEKDLSPTSSAFFPPACSDAIIGSWPVNQNCSFKAKYLLDEKLLGKGAYSNVMSGRSLSNNNQVAVKIIDKVNLMEAELDRLEREVEILKKISHKNILVVLDVFDEPSKYYIVTDFMGGGDLLTKVEELTSLDEKTARGVCKSLLSAVNYLHARPLPIAHRDIKMENILLASSSSEKGDSSPINPDSLRLADFGFSKEEASPNSLTTMCGTQAYVAPEILLKKNYGALVDMWSLGVVAYCLLSGYQPFRAETDSDVQKRIVNGKFVFDETYWCGVSDNAKSFIRSLLVTNPRQRATAESALNHPWFRAELEPTSLQTEVSLTCSASQKESQKPKVFFMIGCQRSGSNWLRTMLDQREDIVAPHPPHVVRDFMPIIDKFGPLCDDGNFLVLVDHVCAFVENNQVPWQDKHGQLIQFSRRTVFEQAKASCSRLRGNRKLSGFETDSPLENELYLISVLDSVMDFFAKANSKPSWLCKSMGMSQHHKYLLEFYGTERLRYIYLVRDPRDVAMSFMKTPVGDCHYYAITKKWTKLQDHALKILEADPSIICKVHYEEILENKEAMVGKVYNFIGERRFGGIKRQASVMFMAPSKDLIKNAKSGRESMNAHTLSYQFKNLIRGDSFAKQQNEKWRDPLTGLKDNELEIIESVAHSTMQFFGYETKLVGKTMGPIEFTDRQIAEFEAINEQAKIEMMEMLRKENTADYDRRVRQAEVLKKDPTWMSDVRKDCSSNFDFTNDDSLPEAILSSITNGMEIEFEEQGDLVGFGSFICGAATMKGYYPSDPHKKNQDRFDVSLDLSDRGVNYLAVYDGHGPDGEKCSQLAKTMIPELFSCYRESGMSTKRALSRAMQEVHDIMLKTRGIESELSGTTAISALLEKDRLTICNIGDSIAITGMRPHAGNQQKTLARFISVPHDLNRSDEVARIENSGGLVLSSDDYTSSIQGNSCGKNESSNVLRVWSANVHDKLPGCAFSRSLGDSIAHDIGVCAKPEFSQMRLKSGQIIILASDGVTEFLCPEKCIAIATKYVDPTEAAEALVGDALKEWSKLNDYVDDITAIVIFVD